MICHYNCVNENIIKINKSSKSFYKEYELILLVMPWHLYII